jgi:transposase InsO family protein
MKQKHHSSEEFIRILRQAETDETIDKDHQIKTLYIELGSPWQNEFIERFHSRFRDECLNREWLLNLREARIVIEDWRLYYNKERPHSQLGYISPDEFRLNQKVSPQVGQNG